MNKYYKIREEVYQREDLDIYEKFLFSIIEHYGECRMKNSQFESILTSNERTITRKISSLVEKQFIEIYYVKGKRHLRTLSLPTSTLSLPDIDFKSILPDFKSTPSRIRRNIKGKELGLEPEELPEESLEGPKDKIEFGVVPSPLRFEDRDDTEDLFEDPQLEIPIVEKIEKDFQPISESRMLKLLNQEQKEMYLNLEIKEQCEFNINWSMQYKNK